MTDTITVRKFDETEVCVYRSLRLSALQESPDAFGSTFNAEQSRTIEEWVSRLHAGCRSGTDLPVVGLVGSTAAGLAWVKIDHRDGAVINLYQMWVRPEYRSRGVARSLLRTVIAWAGSVNARAVQLGVTCGESPAMRLYLSEGFVPVGSVEPLRPGSNLLAQNMRFQISNTAV